VEKTAERIEVLFGMTISGRPKEHCFKRGSYGKKRFDAAFAKLLSPLVEVASGYQLYSCLLLLLLLLPAAI